MNTQTWIVVAVIGVLAGLCAYWDHCDRRRRKFQPPDLTQEEIEAIRKTFWRDPPPPSDFGSRDTTW